MFDSFRALPSKQNNVQKRWVRSSAHKGEGKINTAGLDRKTTHGAKWQTKLQLINKHPDRKKRWQKGRVKKSHLPETTLPFKNSTGGRILLWNAINFCCFVCNHAMRRENKKNDYEEKRCDNFFGNSGNSWPWR